MEEMNLPWRQRSCWQSSGRPSHRTGSVWHSPPSSWPRRTPSQTFPGSFWIWDSWASPPRQLRHRDPGEGWTGGQDWPFATRANYFRCQPAVQKKPMYKTCKKIDVLVLDHRPWVYSFLLTLTCTSLPTELVWSGGSRYSRDDPKPSEPRVIRPREEIISAPRPRGRASTPE